MTPNRDATPAAGLAADRTSTRPLAEPSAQDARLEALLTRVARGDHQAFEAVYDLTSPIVYGVCVRILRRKEEAEEAAADAYMQVWRHAGAYASERGSVVSWLVTIARSRAIDRLRWNDARQAEPLPPVEPVDRAESPEARAFGGELAGLLRAAMARLPREQRQVIELVGFGLTHSELAERLRLPLGTVKTRARLALRRLRSELAIAKA
ncbi:MAG: sigma-70 family RNA polymerase sigma factor [Vicinamibacterales bacterium]